MAGSIQIITFVGGLAFFLLGIETLSTGLQQMAGDRFKQLLASFTQTRFKGVVTGTVLTSAIQSSSATTVMLVALVEAQLLTFTKALAVVLGAGLGTTITAQLIAFHIENYALLIVFFGLLLSYTKRDTLAYKLSNPLIGFGLIFYGMHLMSAAMAPIQEAPWFLNLIEQISRPLPALAIGIFFTALMQSSGAFIGILIVLAANGSINLTQAIPFILGANLGTTITAFIASLKTSREAFKVAVAHGIIKLTGIFIFFWWMPVYADWVKIITQLVVTEGAQADAGRMIANAHTFYNLLLTFMFFPLLQPLAFFLNKILPQPTGVEYPQLELTSIESIKNPQLALSVARHETEKFAIYVQKYTGQMLGYFNSTQKQDAGYPVEIYHNIDEQYRRYHHELLTLSKKNPKEKEANESFLILFTLKEFFQIARIMHFHLPYILERWRGGNFAFSEEGKNELTDYHLKMQKQISRAIEAFQEVDIDKALHMKSKYKKYRAMASELEEQHFSRIREDIKVSVQSSSFHLHLLTLIRDMNSHATNIARLLLRWSAQES